MDEKEIGGYAIALREMTEIVHSAPLPRFRDEDGTEYVSRDDLIREMRAHAVRRTRTYDRPS